MVTATEASPDADDDLAGAGLATAELELGGMHCSACATRIQRSLTKVPAVASASVNLATHRAFVSYDPGRAGDDDLVAAVDGRRLHRSPSGPRTGADRARRPGPLDGPGWRSRGRWPSPPWSSP